MKNHSSSWELKQSQLELGGKIDANTEKKQTLKLSEKNLNATILRGGERALVSSYKHTGSKWEEKY